LSDTGLLDGDLLDRREAGGNATVRALGAGRHHRLRLVAEGLLEERDAVRQRLPPLGQLGPLVDRGEGVAPPDIGATDQERELLAPVRDRDL